MTFPELPTDIKMYILSMLSLMQIGKVSRVCKEWYTMINEKSVLTLTNTTEIANQLPSMSVEDFLKKLDQPQEYAIQIDSENSKPSVINRRSYGFLLQYFKSQVTVAKQMNVTRNEEVGLFSQHEEQFNWTLNNFPKIIGLTLAFVLLYGVAVYKYIDDLANASAASRVLFLSPLFLVVLLFERYMKYKTDANAELGTRIKNSRNQFNLLSNQFRAAQNTNEDFSGIKVVIKKKTN
jgi:hypothetical protein